MLGAVPRKELRQVLYEKNCFDAGPATFFGPPLTTPTSEAFVCLSSCSVVCSLQKKQSFLKSTQGHVSKYLINSAESLSNIPQRAGFVGRALAIEAVVIIEYHCSVTSQKPCEQITHLFFQ